MFKWRNMLYDAVLLHGMIWYMIPHFNYVMSHCTQWYMTPLYQMTSRCFIWCCFSWCTLCDMTSLHFIWHNILYSTYTAHHFQNSNSLKINGPISTGWSPGKVMYQFCSCSHQGSYCNSKDTVLHLKYTLIEIFS